MEHCYYQEDLDLAAAVAAVVVAAAAVVVAVVAAAAAAAVEFLGLEESKANKP